ncbi:galactose mutarotase [Shewanella avicenniae]|uniref:Aldose 1-epimerase n=1 Tax=Shewanella avicenniae TaxID=2814294 RepID=A0ABX7QND4_9GAMM|nr:aldose epimerase family protein [Shewanella avicenniae]QSX32958.1 galactose mutarotase [Shewanella avicenniae]
MVRCTVLDPWLDPRGGQVERVRVDNGTLAIEVLSLGAIIRCLWVPDRNGDRANVVLGCDSVADYLTQQAWIGSVAGRYANRIKNGQIHYDGQTYQLDTNLDGHCLHGGSEGFHRRHWDIGILPDGVRLSLVSADGDMGFPGNCVVQLDYRLVGHNLFVEFTASSDKACPISLTQHSYFNLDKSDTINQHWLQVSAPNLLKPDADKLPLELISLTDSPFDLRGPKKIEPLLQQHPDGIDHCYVLDCAANGLQKAAQLMAPKSGRRLTLHTNQPGLQVYTGNYIEGIIGRKQQPLRAHQALCLEPQMLPDAPNQPQLGDPWITPGKLYHHISRYEFDTIN